MAAHPPLHVLRLHLRVPPLPRAFPLSAYPSPVPTPSACAYVPSAVLGSLADATIAATPSSLPSPSVAAAGFIIAAPGTLPIAVSYTTALLSPTSAPRCSKGTSIPARVAKRRRAFKFLAGRIERDVVQSALCVHVYGG